MKASVRIFFIAALVSVLSLRGETTIKAVSYDGLFVIGGENFASIKFESDGSRWMKPGDRFSGTLLVRLDDSGNTAVFQDPSGLEYRIHLSADWIRSGPEPLLAPQPAIRFPLPRPAPGIDHQPKLELYETYPSSPEAERSREGLDEDWIKSEQNPMRVWRVRLNAKEALKWFDYDEKQKADLIEFYRQHGWNLTVGTSNYGVTRKYRHIYYPNPVAVYSPGNSPGGSAPTKIENK